MVRTGERSELNTRVFSNGILLLVIIRDAFDEFITVKFTRHLIEADQVMDFFRNSGFLWLAYLVMVIA
jgi:hypothetical protein